MRRPLLLVPLLLVAGCARTTEAGVPVGPVWVTLAYVGLYYGFQLLVMRTKIRLAKAYRDRGEKFDRYFSQDREMLAADRVQLNMLEHMPVFLVLLWLHALAGDAAEATWAGAIYTGLRALYPLLLGGSLGRFPKPRLYFVTFGGYAVLLYMAVRIGMAAA